MVSVNSFVDDCDVKSHDTHWLLCQDQLFNICLYSVLCHVQDTSRDQSSVFMQVPCAPE
jgi:hypothetical protein